MTEREVTLIDLSKDFDVSAARLTELKAGRDNGDIPQCLIQMADRRI